MKNCPKCQSTFATNFTLCPHDGALLVDSTEWSEGTVIRGKYRILSQIGAGGMAVVYKTVHQGFDDLCALKAIRSELTHDTSFVQRFKREATLTRKLRHPNAVRVDDIDEDEDGRPFMVMEYIEGRSLEAAIEQEAPMSARQAASIAKQVAAALDAAHRLGIVHRDIKPGNIVLASTAGKESASGLTGSVADAPEVVKVLDFGIAKAKEAQAADPLTLTGSGMLVGTPAYMSPEQAMGKRGDELDGRSDIYSLGIVMYQMLTGDLPLKAESAWHLVMAQIQTPPLEIRSARPDLPEPIAALVMSCLEKDPARRPASAAAVIDQIEAWEKRPGIATAPKPESAPEPPAGATSPAPGSAPGMPHPSATAVLSGGSIPLSAATPPSSAGAASAAESAHPGIANAVSPVLSQRFLKRASMGAVAILALGVAILGWRLRGSLPLVSRLGRSGATGVASVPPLARPTVLQAGEVTPVSYLRLIQNDGQGSDVSYRRGDDDIKSDWKPAPVNVPLTPGDWVHTSGVSRGELQLGEHSFLRLGHQASMSILQDKKQAFQFKLTSGTATMAIDQLDRSYEVDAPVVAFAPLETGTYRFDVSDDGGTDVHVERGQGVATTADGVNHALTAPVTLRVPSALGAKPREQNIAQHDSWDDWSNQRDAATEQSPSGQYVPPGVEGYDTLDGYGRWVSTADNGFVWIPAADPGWVPYRLGHWVWVDPYGWTWASYEPWGWAPYHYGRWMYVEGTGWAWVPGPRTVAQRFASALVGFISGELAGAWVGWFPLGPREEYEPVFVRPLIVRPISGYVNFKYLTIVSRSEICNSTAEVYHTRVIGPQIIARSQTSDFVALRPTAQNLYAPAVRMRRDGGRAAMIFAKPAVTPPPAPWVDRQIVARTPQVPSVRPFSEKLTEITKTGHPVTAVEVDRPSIIVRRVPSEAARPPSSPSRASKTSEPVQSSVRISGKVSRNPLTGDVKTGRRLQSSTSSPPRVLAAPATDMTPKPAGGDKEASGPETTSVVTPSAKDERPPLAPTPAAPKVVVAAPGASGDVPATGEHNSLQPSEARKPRVFTVPPFPTVDDKTAHSVSPASGQPTSQVHGRTTARPGGQSTSPSPQRPTHPPGPMRRTADWLANHELGDESTSKKKSESKNESSSKKEPGPKKESEARKDSEPKRDSEPRKH